MPIQRWTSLSHSGARQVLKESSSTSGRLFGMPGHKGDVGLNYDKDVRTQRVKCMCEQGQVKAFGSSAPHAEGVGITFARLYSSGGFRSGGYS